jgi:hypothetical protein
VSAWILAALLAVVALGPAEAAAQVKFNPAPPPAPPPIFETSPNHIIQTLYKPVATAEPKRAAAPQGTDLASVAARINQAMQEMLKKSQTPKAADVASKAADVTPKVAEGASKSVAAAAPAAAVSAPRVHLQWNQRVELTWPIEIGASAAPATDRISLSWR